MKKEKLIVFGVLVLSIFLTTSCRDIASDYISAPAKVPEEHLTTSNSDMEDILYENISSFKTSFTFDYPEKLYPEQVLDEVKSSLFGTYYSGVFHNELKVEVTTREFSNSSKVTVKTGYLHTKSQEDSLDRAVDSILNQVIKPGMSDVDKIKAIYDFIAINSHYSLGDSQNLTESGISVHSPYAIVKDGMGVCQAYALLNYKLLENAGIEVMYVTGTASDGDEPEQHAWNLVYLNGRWHHSDPTWGDPYPDVAGRVQYDYYMKSDDEFSQTHSWDEISYPRANGSVDMGFRFQDMLN